MRKRIMRIATLASIAGLALLGTTVFAQNVTYDFDKATDFSQLKTYAWVRGTNLNDELNHKRIVDAIDTQLASKGFTKVQVSANPDVFVAYHASFDKNLQINGFSSGPAAYRLGPARAGSARVEEILIGTLTVNMVGARSKTIVWRGTATKEVDINASPEKRERNISRAAEKLFKNYPPNK
jgi:hypothetical protein